MSRPAAPAPPPPRSGLRAGWSRLDHRQRRVAAAAALVLVTMVLPWFSEKKVTPNGSGAIVGRGSSVSGLAGMSFIEASVLVVLIGVFALLWGRATGRRFTLPYPDGSLICAAAGWMGALIVYRLFAQPHDTDTARAQTLIGLNWGVFVSLLAVGLLFAAGFDLRQHAPRSVVPGDPEPVPPSGAPDVDPATIVVRPRSDEHATTVVPALRDDQPTAVVPSPGDGQPTRRVPAAPPRSEDQPTAVTPLLEDQPTAVTPPVRPGRRTPTPPARPTDAEPGRDTWPSRMRRPPRTPMPRKSDGSDDDRRSGPPDA